MLEIIWTGDIPCIVQFLRAILVGKKPVLLFVSNDVLSPVREKQGIRFLKSVNDQWGNCMADFLNDPVSGNVVVSWRTKRIPGDFGPANDDEFLRAWEQLMDWREDWDTTILPDPDQIFEMMCPCTQKSTDDHFRARANIIPPFDGLCGCCDGCSRFLKNWADEFYCDEWMTQASN